MLYEICLCLGILNSVSSLHSIALCCRDLHFHYWGTGVPFYIFQWSLSIRVASSVLVLCCLDCPFPPHISQVCSDPCSAVSISSLLCHSCLSYITLSSIVLHPTFHGQVSASCDPLFSFLIQQVSLKGPLHRHLKFHTF